MKKLNLVLLLAGIMAFASCASGSQTTNNQEGRSGNKKPDSTRLMSEMDANKDGMLSKQEVKGPLQNDFDTIDTNSDGYITKEELDKAPKPQGGRPPRRN